MGGLLSGLASLGLGNLENKKIYEKPKKENDKAQQGTAAVVSKMEEKDYIYDRSFECPVCGTKFTSKTMKTGKARLIETDMDLRPKYDGIDVVKYDVEVCPVCGFAALSRFFKNMTPMQAKMIKQNISSSVKLHEYKGEIYTYEEALERYKLALACAVVKMAKAGEKAYICLKSAWLLRGYAEHLDDQVPEYQKKMAELSEEEENYLQNAYEGFVDARQTEPFPICGMDETTMDYLLAVLARRFKQYDVASRMVSSILTSNSANNRMKDKARDLKEMLKEDMKKGN